MRVIKLIIFLMAIGLFAQAQVPGSTIDVQHYRFALQLNDADNVIKGQAAITVKFLKASAKGFDIDLVKKNETGKGMLVSSVTESGKVVKKIPFAQNNETLHLSAAALVGSMHTYTITYQGIPADGLIISTNMYGHRTFFGDNWPNRAHNWLPCVDNVADKASVEFVVTAPAHYKVVANGLKTEEKALPAKMRLTHWSETAKLATKIMVIGVAEFAVNHPADVKGTPLYTYVFPEDSTQGFHDYAVAKDIMPFYISKVGPFAYKKLANVQSKTIFGGMENAGCIFYFEKSVGDKGIEALMAHEIAHQWFGDAASEKSFAHLWLSEGFATFMTNAYLEFKYGEDTLKKRLTDDKNLVLGFEKTRNTPVVDTTVKSNFMQMLNANSYQKGGWVLQMLRKKIGDDKFWVGVKNYFAKYNGGNANTADFEKVMEQASGQDLQRFFKEWLYSTGTPDLTYTQQYDESKHLVLINITQNQQVPFEFPLKIRVDGKPTIVNIKYKTNAVAIASASAPATVALDPDVEVLCRLKRSDAQ